MPTSPCCPRCQRPVVQPNLWSPDWRCAAHGSVEPLQAVAPLSAQLLRQVVDKVRVPMWLPWPLPAGWLVTGAAWTGDDRGRGTASALALSGPSLVGGPADLVFVAEEAGVGLGAGLAGLTSVDPPPEQLADVPTTRISAGGSPTALWSIGPANADRAVYVGEARGCWLWALAWPSEVSLELHDGMTLLDLADTEQLLDVPVGASSPRLPQA